MYDYGGDHNALVRWLKETTPKNVDILTPVNEWELCDPGAQNILDIANGTEDVPLEQFQYAQKSQGLSSLLLILTVDQEQLQFPNDFHDQLWQMHSNPGLLHPVKQEPRYDKDSFYHQYYTSQESLPMAHLDISDTETHQRPPPMTYHVRSDPQHYTLSQGGMSQSHSTRNSPIHRAISRRPTGRPGQGYGKLTFIRRPDVLGNTDTWSLHERQDNRRIVAFHKEIRGEVIQLDCYPVAAHEYNENMITISCIRWIPSPANELRHKLAGECVFTSVDIILLLEKLVGYQFDVQEKNRIRRNLEGYKPETVKKEGTTRQFFNQVMLYAQPKTRNIEKDIKVFLWKDLAKALKKVVQKYSKRMELANNTPSSEPSISSQALSSSLPNSQPSSTESLPTQRTFMNGPDYNGTEYNGPEYDSADYNSNSDFPEPSRHTLMEWQSVLGSGSQFAYSMPLHAPSSVLVDSGTMAGSQMYYSQDESGDTSSISISPTSQITQLGGDYGQMIDGSSGLGQQGLEAYVHDIPGEFTM